MIRNLAIGLASVFCLAQASRAADVPRFNRHVAAVFSKAGCNGGTCHGAVKGQAGFRLSLFGADPELDRDRLLREDGGRRLNLVDPDISLLLLKATARVPHQGGRRLSMESADYAILRRWIAAGAPVDSVAESRVAQLRITPAEQTAKPNESYPLKVEAKFAGGTVEDVTALCSFTSLNTQVASVDPGGLVHVDGVGETALIVRYRAEPAMALVMVPRPGTEAFPQIELNNFIDRHILAKLQRLNLPPADLADDVTFLRRACLDVTGELPKPAEIRAFVTDKNPQKRARKIEELLGRPGHAVLWTLKFCDLLKGDEFGVYADGMKKEADAPRFQQWIRARLEENIPYDQFAERILTATSRDGKSMEEYAEELLAMTEGHGPERKDIEIYRQRKTLDLYWQRGNSVGVKGALQVAHAFLGLRLECAQCHRHPHDIWQQADLLDFANFFTRVRRVGFGGNNEKLFPDAGTLFKKYGEEGKRLTEEAKKMRKELDKYKGEPDKAKKLREELAGMEKRGRMLDEAARRLMHAEIRHLPDDKLFASVTSPIGTQKSQQFRLLGQTDAVPVAKDQDPRALVVAWLRRPDNPYFARAIVNRVWAHYFGRGIVDPPDHLSPFNPASHPALLQELCDGFVQNQYDLRWLHRTILNSRTYQQSSTAPAASAADRANYAYFAYRRLGAEVLVDALNQATGTTEKMDMKFHFWPDEMKTVEIPFTPKNAFVSYMLEQFGRPKRNNAVQCDCERDGSASILQVLSFANHPRVWEKIVDPNGQATRIAKEMKDDNQRIDEVFLTTLSRWPTDAERQACGKYLKEAESPEKGVQGLSWSLVNTREFFLQH